jgi:thymidylate synthase (FAD)
VSELTTKILDHGYVTLRNISGPTRRIYSDPENFKDLNPTDEYQTFDLKSTDFRPFDADDVDPAQVARISFDNLDAERTKEQDHKLYEYLLANKHSSPIEMIETWWEMKLPIFLARQFIRHRTASVNELSGRYATLPAEWYIPEVVGGKAKSNKQGQEDNLSEDRQHEFRAKLWNTCNDAYDTYLYFLDQGVAPEHARMFLHVNHYTSWVWKMDLSNLMHFLALRMDSHAQVEARIYAQAMFNLLEQYLPKSMELFNKYRRL